MDSSLWMNSLANKGSLFYSQHKERNLENVENNVLSSYDQDKAVDLVKHLNQIKDHLNVEQDHINQSCMIPICEELEVIIRRWKLLALFKLNKQSNIESSICK